MYHSIIKIVDFFDGLDLSRNSNIRSYFIYFDFAKAFDSVNQGCKSRGMGDSSPKDVDPGIGHYGGGRYGGGRYGGRRYGGGHYGGNLPKGGHYGGKERVTHISEIF